MKVRMIWNGHDAHIALRERFFDESAEYRRHPAGVLLRRALKETEEETGAE